MRAAFYLAVLPAALFIAASTDLIKREIPIWLFTSLSAFFLIALRKTLCEDNLAGFLVMGAAFLLLAITGKENIYLYNLDTYENYFIFKAKEWVTSFYTLSDGSILIGKGNGVEHVYYQPNENKLMFLESIDDKDNFWGVASIVENNKNDLIFGLRDRKIRIWSKN